MTNDAWKKLEVTLKFKGEELQKLVDALAQLPFHMSVHFINSIQAQSTPQFAEFHLKTAKESNQEKESQNASGT